MLNKTIIDPKIKVRTPSELLDTNHTLYVSSIEEENLSGFIKEFKSAEETGQEIIPIVIDSFGGDAYTLLAMIDVIKASDVKIATVALGKAMSCGSALLTCGTDGYRYASPNSTIMIHHLSMGTEGKIEDVRIDTHEGERLNDIIFGIMDKNCGLRPGTLQDSIYKGRRGGDWYLSPEEAKKFNIVNHVRVPNITTKITVETEIW